MSVEEIRQAVRAGRIVSPVEERRAKRQARRERFAGMTAQEIVEGRRRGDFDDLLGRR